MTFSIPFSFDGEKWVYSLYSQTVDVSKMLKENLWWWWHKGKGAAGVCEQR